MSEEPQAATLLEPQEVLELTKDLVGESCLEMSLDRDEKLIVWIEPPVLHSVVRALRDHGQLSFRYLVFLTAADYEDHMEALYLFRSMKHKVQVEIRARMEREHPSIPTLATLYSTACWHERESYDMFGIFYEGHPELTHILTGGEGKAFPLRKDARPKRIQRREWHWRGYSPYLRLPEERDRGERS